MCILLAEDDELIREIMAETLLEAGFSVCRAENGDRALAASASISALCLLITDVDMPGSGMGSNSHRNCAGRLPICR